MRIRPNDESFGKGGDGGEVFIIAGKMVGDGSICVNGGDGSLGGRAGKITIISGDNQFTGVVSAKGGKSATYRKWWEKTWVQLTFLLSALLGIVVFFLGMYG